MKARAITSPLAVASHTSRRDGPVGACTLNSAASVSANGSAVSSSLMIVPANPSLCEALVIVTANLAWAAPGCLLVQPTRTVKGL
jgi:hypothetical protein